MEGKFLLRSRQAAAADPTHQGRRLARAQKLHSACTVAGGHMVQGVQHLTTSGGVSCRAQWHAPLRAAAAYSGACAELLPRMEACVRASSLPGAGIAGLALFVAEDAYPHTPLLHAGWHCLSAGTLMPLQALLVRDSSAPERRACLAHRLAWRGPHCTCR